jgi:hypothetical protein
VSGPHRSARAAEGVRELNQSRKHQILKGDQRSGFGSLVGAGPFLAHDRQARYDNEDLMTTHQPAMHVLIWRDPTGGTTPGAGTMWGWQEFHSRGGGMFQKHGDPGWIGAMAKRVLCADFGAMMRNTNVTVAWQLERPEGRTSAALEPIFRDLRPMTLICPARPRGSDWALSNFGAPQVISAGSVQRTIDAMVPEMFPEWRHGIQFQPQGFMLRHDVSAEEMGLIEPVKISPDDIYASVADDPAVIEAGKLWDRATPSTHRDLVAAVLAAQERASIAPEDRAPISSGEVDGFLIPIIMRMGKGDEPMVLDQMRRQLRARYGEFAELVLGFMLRTYRHDGVAGLLQLATKAAA